MGANAIDCKQMNCPKGYYTNKNGSVSIDDDCIQCPGLKYSPGGNVLSCSIEHSFKSLGYKSKTNRLNYVLLFSIIMVIIVIIVILLITN